MREILFRAKAINRDIGYHRTNYKNGDWVYGLVTKLYDERFDLPAEMTDINGVSGIEVDYKTIDQYTGLKDKNGKRIFEGDILACITSDYDGSYRYVRYVFTDITNHESIVYFEYCNEYEVIGNIHDNPELLR